VIVHTQFRLRPIFEFSLRNSLELMFVDTRFRTTMALQYKLLDLLLKICFRNYPDFGVLGIAVKCG
jgi:hypothetical protein